jgi:hypothetical protein
MCKALGMYLQLCPHEQKYLRDIVGMWIEGHEGVMDDITQDRSIDDEDQLLELATGMHDQVESAQRMYERLSI